MKCVFFLNFMIFWQEVWTLCRIVLKRNASCKKYYSNIPDWREVSYKTNPVDDEICKTCGSVEMMNGSTQENYVVSSELSSSDHKSTMGVIGLHGFIYCKLIGLYFWARARARALPAPPQDSINLLCLYHHAS